MQAMVSINDLILFLLSQSLALAGNTKGIHMTWETADFLTQWHIYLCTHHLAVHSSSLLSNIRVWNPSIQILWGLDKISSLQNPYLKF